MKTSTNTIILFLIFLIINFDRLIDSTHALSNFNQKLSDQIGIEPNVINNLPSINDDYQIEKKLSPKIIHPILNERRSDSAEKYFHWASKTHRPMEYWRGKRFWLFTKNDEHVRQYGAMPHTSGSTDSFRQGIWRSGIVGRRRR